MRRAMGGVAFLVLAMVSGGAGAQEVPDEPGAISDGDEAGDDDGAEEQATPGGPAASSRPHFDEDEDEGWGGARIVEVPPARTTAPRVAPVSSGSPAPSLGSVAAKSAPTAPRAAAGAPSSETQAEFDPYAEHPVRAYLGTAGLGSFVLHQQPGRELMQAGGGISVVAGVDLGAWIGLELGYTGSFHTAGVGCADTWSSSLCGGDHVVLDLVSLDMRLHLPTGTHLVPFLQAGGLLGWMGRDNRVPAMSGAGFEAGGGLEGWLGDYVTLAAKVLYRGVQFSDATNARGGRNDFLELVTTSIELGVHF